MRKQTLNRETEEWLTAYILGQLDEEERRKAKTWIEETPENRSAYESLLRDCLRIRWAQEDRRIQTVKAWRRISAALQRKRRRWSHIAAAASVACVFVLAGVLLSRKETPTPVAQQTIQPIHTQATLILSTGKAVNLIDSPGDIKEQDGSVVTVDSAAGLRYDSLAVPATQTAPIYNKIIVPRGGEYFVTLADGTQVWLDAESELEYPVQFNTDSRQVKLKGKAYFSVTKDERKPFVVRANEFALRVYGTEFNIEARDERHIETVLVEGAVGFRANGKTTEQRLRPGQLAVANTVTGETEIRKVNVASYVAWKNREIVFENERLDRIMDEVARWYDVEVFFQNEDLKALRFDCNMPRYADIQDLFYFMEQTSDARFSVNGKTVIVSKK